MTSCHANHLAKDSSKVKTFTSVIPFSDFCEELKYIHYKNKETKVLYNWGDVF